MRILVVGGGGREHAISWKLAQNATVDKMFAVPGNAGIAELAECFTADPNDGETIGNLAEDLGIDLVVVGPEAPLVAGLADELSARGLAVFGPSRAAARIEGSKAWAKEILERSGAPAARSRAFTDPADATRFLDDLAAPFVVKADGLAAGKGVAVCEDRASAVRAIEERMVEGAFGAAGATVVIEEYLEGEELSVFCLTDGTTVMSLAEAQDFKRAYDGDRGPNTGGMGSYSPVPHRAHLVTDIVRDIMEPVVRTMAAEGVPYKGLLYGGIMLTADGPKVFEFNCRFGDPEAQVILPRLESDLAELLLAVCEGNLAHHKPAMTRDACVGVALASAGYPGEFERGKVITGLERANAREGVVVFHAGTARHGNDVVTNGGRVLVVSALGRDVADARARAYEAVEEVSFEGRQFRSDIAAKITG